MRSIECGGCAPPVVVDTDYLTNEHPLQGWDVLWSGYSWLKEDKYGRTWQAYHDTATGLMQFRILHDDGITLNKPMQRHEYRELFDE